MIWLQLIIHIHDVCICISSIEVGPHLYMIHHPLSDHRRFTLEPVMATRPNALQPEVGVPRSSLLWWGRQQKCGRDSRAVSDTMWFMVFFEHLDGMSIQMAGLHHDVLRIHIGGMIPATSFDLDTYSYGCFICPAANCAQSHWKLVIESFPYRKFPQ